MKDKRRNSEKRKEKSRDAARCRRSKETEIFFELGEMLPLQASTISQLDKASVMRLCISYLKLRRIMEPRQWSDETQNKPDTKSSVDQLFPKALDGFVFILSQEGDIVYISENVSKFLGIQQLELTGQSIFEFLHPRDEDEIHEAFSMKSHVPNLPIEEREERTFLLRMKCTLTSKGRNVNLKSASYKTIMCTGHLLMQTERHQSERVSCSAPYLVAIGEPIPHPANIEMPMDSNTFLSKHDMDMKFSYCDERVQELLGYNCQELAGKSLYDFHHAMDSDIVDKAYKDLFSKGQTMTGCYRFLARGGGWVRMVTQATVIYNNRNQKAQWVVCVHYVLSHIESHGQILSEAQLPKSEVFETLPQQTTGSVFSLKTDDIEEGYYIPADMKVKMRNMEPENLTYLAPTAGDECVPLGFPSQWDVTMGNMRADGNAIPSPCSLAVSGIKQEPELSPGLCGTGDRQPFGKMSPMSSISTAPSSRISSPPDFAQETSPAGTMYMDQFFHAVPHSPMDIADCSLKQTLDFNGRAPYVPMNGFEDRCMIPPSANALLTMQNEVDPGLFGRTESVCRPKTEDIFEEPPQPPKPSLRDMICGSTAMASIEQPPDIRFEQTKLQWDVNKLEKGPPHAKLPRMMQPQHHLMHAAPTKRGSNMLLNLLMTGEEPCGYGMMPMPAATSVPKVFAPNNFKYQLSRLTQHDCEVNAPTHFGHLLDGDDLLNALEYEIPQTPR